MHRNDLPIIKMSQSKHNDLLPSVVSLFARYPLRISLTMTMNIVTQISIPKLRKIRLDLLREFRVDFTFAFMHSNKYIY